MARVVLMPGVESISGTIGNKVFRTINGKTFVYGKAEAVLRPHASMKEKKQYKKRVIVDECVELIQSEMEDVLGAIRMRKKIRDCISRIYDKHAPTIRARTKLQGAIMSEYRSKHRKSHCFDTRKPLH